MENEPQDMQDVKMKLYALYLKDLQTMGSRQEHVRKYYITLISAIFTILSLGGNALAFKVTPSLVWLVSIFGILLCILWLVHMISYRTLFAAKFAVLKKMELQLPFKPFTDEYGAKKEANHFQMTWMDILIAGLFIGLFCALLFLPRVVQP
jgi:hypothetical protein